MFSQNLQGHELKSVVTAVPFVESSVLNLDVSRARNVLGFCNWYDAELSLRLACDWYVEVLTKKRNSKEVLIEQLSTYLSLTI